MGTDFKSVPGRLCPPGTDFKPVPGRLCLLGTDFKSVPGRSGIQSNTLFIIFIHAFGSVTPVWPWYFPFLSL